MRLLVLLPKFYDHSLPNWPLVRNKSEFLQAPLNKREQLKTCPLIYNFDLRHPSNLATAYSSRYKLFNGSPLFQLRLLLFMFSLLFLLFLCFNDFNVQGKRQNCSDTRQLIQFCEWLS